MDNFIKKNILIVLGTRPEAIKLAPVILELAKYPHQYNVILCNTEQQKELSRQTLSFFNLKADINLNVMGINQTLVDLQVKIMSSLKTVFGQNKIDAVIVQGDTMSVFSGALVSFYHKIPIFHLEAGLRSFNLTEPYPEEALRQMVSKITDLHFAPTKQAVDNLLNEGILGEKIIEVGNTVIDALNCLSEAEINNAQKYLKAQGIIFNDKLVLLTVHRRENHGTRLANILEAIKFLAHEFNDHQFIIPVHPNPNVKFKILESLSSYHNVILLTPLDYPVLVSLLEKAKLIITDSGGIQEEASTFNVPILVLRYETERQEGVTAGIAKLVGADYSAIIKEGSLLLNRSFLLSRTNKIHKNLYGDGKASQKIKSSMDDYFSKIVKGSSEN